MALNERQPRHQLEASIGHLGRIAPDWLEASNQAPLLRANAFRASHQTDREARIAIAAVELVASLPEEPHALKALSFVEWAWTSMENRRLLLARQLRQSASLVANGAQGMLDAAQDLRGVVSILCSARLSLLGSRDITDALQAVAHSDHAEVAAAAGLAAQVMAFRGGTRSRTPPE